MATPSTLTYEYRFHWSGEAALSVPIVLDAQTLEHQRRTTDDLPEWTRLSSCQCPNCPLSEATHERCPVASNVADLLDTFSDASSHQSVEVTVVSDARTYVRETTTQEGLASILGLFMATSGCPVLDPLRPMARFHLPFASYEETAYRALSMYLVSQHVRAQHGQTADWALNGFVQMYRDIQVVNAAFAARLRQFVTQDANANALVILDCFAALISLDAELQRSLPESLEPLFLTPNA
jgi:hypothetical protein